MSRKSRKRNRSVKNTNVNAPTNQVRIEGSSADWTEMRTMPAGMLNVDPRYQRYLDMGWVRTIVANFDPDLVKTLQISYRDGQYWVFDGQHTLTALKEKFHDDNYPVVCKIYHGLTLEEEAKLFYRFNNSSKKMSAASMLKAQSVYGDEDVKEFLQHTKDAGFIIDPAKRVNCKYGIQAVKKAQTCFTTLGVDNYDRMLKLIMKTWEGEQWSITQNMLGGMCTFIKTFGGKIEDDLFVRQLQSVDDVQMKKMAGRYSDESVAVAYASALVNFYNTKQRKNKQLQRSRLLDD